MRTQLFPILAFLVLAAAPGGGLLAQETASRRLAVGAHAGVALPLSGLGDAVDPGFTVGGRVTYRPTRSLGYYAGYSLHRFGFEDGDGHLDIFGPAIGIVVPVRLPVLLEWSLGPALYSAAASRTGAKVWCGSALAGETALTARVPIGERGSASVGGGLTLAFDPDHPCGTEPRPIVLPDPLKGPFGGFRVEVNFRL